MTTAHYSPEQKCPHCGSEMHPICSLGDQETLEDRTLALAVYDKQVAETKLRIVNDELKRAAFEARAYRSFLAEVAGWPSERSWLAGLPDLRSAALNLLHQFPKEGDPS